MWNGKKVSVVFPAYNEAENIHNAIRDFMDNSNGVIDELIVVDNNSSDATASIAASDGARVVLEKKQGFGNAVIRGLHEASGEYVIVAEPDNTFTGKDVIKFLVYADEFDFVVGTRTSRAMIWEGANMGFFLKFGNWAVAKLLEFLFNGPSLTDVGCTFRLINRKGLEKILPVLSVGGSHFNPEMVIAAILSGLRVVEIPVNYRPRIGVSKITGSLKRTIKTGLKMIALIISYRISSVFSTQNITYR